MVEKSNQVPDNIKQAVNTLDHKERMLGYAGAALCAAIYIDLTVTHLHEHVPKGQQSPIVALAVGLVLAALLAVATFVGRRALVGFAALFIGFSFGSSIILSIPFLALAGWLIMRALRFNREAKAAAQAASASSTSNTSRTGSSRSSPAKQTSSSSSGIFNRSKSHGSRAQAHPEPSKRYTPPKPRKRKPMPPSKEVKAANKDNKDTKDVTGARILPFIGARRSKERA
ncbi:MAG: YjgN family protein [Actinobacteria bacterium]|nr:YjgN family protein [Actinomycetota bacterium]